MFNAEATLRPPVPLLTNFRARAISSRYAASVLNIPNFAENFYWFHKQRPLARITGAVLSHVTVVAAQRVTVVNQNRRSLDGFPLALQN